MYSMFFDVSPKVLLINWDKGITASIHPSTCLAPLLLVLILLLRNMSVCLQLKKKSRLGTTTAIGMSARTPLPAAR